MLELILCAKFRISKHKNRIASTLFLSSRIGVIRLPSDFIFDFNLNIKKAEHTRASFVTLEEIRRQKKYNNSGRVVARHHFGHEESGEHKFKLWIRKYRIKRRLLNIKIKSFLFDGDLLTLEATLTVRGIS